jgi:hypothetical protein
MLWRESPHMSEGGSAGLASPKDSATVTGLEPEKGMAMESGSTEIR